jgi:hypothetical protein
LVLFASANICKDHTKVKQSRAPLFLLLQQWYSKQEEFIIGKFFIAGIIMDQIWLWIRNRKSDDRSDIVAGALVQAVTFQQQCACVCPWPFGFY